MRSTSKLDGEHIMDSKTRYYAICQLDDRRYFWIACLADDAGEAYEVIDSDYAADEASALAQAQVVVGTAAMRWPDVLAALDHQREGHQQRLAERPPRPGQPTYDVLYHLAIDPQGMPMFTPHRVRRHSPALVYVDRPSQANGDTPVCTAALDRTELDFLGETSPADEGELTFYTAEGMQRYLAHPRTAAMRQNRALSAALTRGERPAWAAVLEVAWPCTASDIKQSYRRKARLLHPDAGGDAAAFATLQAAYETALSLLH
jgi:hypothetical protein